MDFVRQNPYLAEDWRASPGWSALVVTGRDQDSAAVEWIQLLCGIVWQAVRDGLGYGNASEPNKKKMEGCEKLVHELQKIKELADEIKKFLKIHDLDGEYVEHISETQQPGNPIPELEEVMGNGALRYDLICFLSYRTSVMQNTNDRWWGKSLIEDLDEMDTVPKTGCDKEKESIAWDMAGLLKDLDYFKYAGYMKTGDHDIDPVRRIYTELTIPEKRQEMVEYLTRFLQTEHGDRIMSMVSSLQALDMEDTKENIKTGHPPCRNMR